MSQANIYRTQPFTTTNMSRKCKGTWGYSSPSQAIQEEASHWYCVQSYHNGQSTNQDPQDSKFDGQQLQFFHGETYEI